MRENCIRVTINYVARLRFVAGSAGLPWCSAVSYTHLTLPTILLV